MKNFLSKLWSLSRTDRVRTLAIDAVSLPSFCRVNMLKLVSILVLIFTLGVGQMWGAGTTVTYTLTAKTTVSKSGTAPTGATATVTSTGSWYTSGSDGRKNTDQMTSGKNTVLTLSGFEGYKITGIVLNMCSNSSAGKGTFSAVAGSTTIASISDATTFNKWYDNTSYGTSRRNVTVSLTNSTYEIKKDEDVVITIACVSTNSLYISSWAITYEAVGGGCDKEVSLATSLSNCTATFTPSGPVKTCSATASDRQVSVSITPTTGYALTSGPTVSGIASATISGSGPYTIQLPQNGNGTLTLSATCTAISVTGVSLNKSSTTIVEGNTETLTATVTPSNALDKAVTWSSGTPGVATVNSSGVVTAVSAGNATITVTTHDGSFTANCTVTVTAAARDHFIDAMHSTTGYTGDGMEKVGNYSASIPSIADKAKNTTGTCQEKHYHFTGWATAANRANPEGNLVTLDGNASNTTYYAVWEEEAAGGASGTESVSWSSRYNETTDVEGVALSIGTNVTVTHNKGTNANTCKYYTTGPGIRVYGGGNFVVEAPSAITAITLTFGTGEGSNAITSDVGTYSNGSWTGSAATVTFSVGGTTGHRRIASISVTYGGGTSYENPKTSCSADPVDPTVTFNNGEYTVGGSALDLRTLWTSNSSGAVTYTVTNANGTGATIAGDGYSFSATTAGSCTVQASQAAVPGVYNAISRTATITVNPPTCATPTFNNGTGTYNNDVSVTISCATASSTIHYTTGASPADPTCSSGSTGTSVTISSTGTTLKAIACKADYNVSTVASATYTLKCATPTFSVAAGTYTSTQSVELSCSTTNAVIHYTTDGSTPTESSPTYSSAITVDDDMTIKAIAFKTNYASSDAAEAAYRIKNCTWYESFDTNSGNGGNNGTWSGISSFSSPSFDNSGWTVTSGGAGDACIKSGTSGTKGSATTPAITVDNGATGKVKFRMGPWNSTGSSAQVVFTGAEVSTGVSTWTSADAMSNGEWNDYQVDFTTTGTSLTIEFTVSGGDNRFWLDEVCVKMDPAAYTVTFDANGHGTAPDPITDVAKNSTISKPTPDPSATGWTFGGWYKEPACTNAWTWATDQVTSNTTLYAKWTCSAPSSLNIAATPNKGDFCPGESLSLQVSGTNVGAGATYVWKKNGVAIVGAPNSDTYTVASMTRDDAGTYTCTVSNGDCSATSSDYGVKVWTLYINNGAADAYQHLNFTNNGTNTGTNATVYLTSDKEYEFKVTNGYDGNSNWFGNSARIEGTTSSAWTLYNGDIANCRILSGLEGNYTFTINYSDAGAPTISVTYPTGNQTANYSIWFDKSVIDGWGSGLYYRIGNTTWHKNNTKTGGTAWTLVPGTDNFYTTKTMEFTGFDAWAISNNSAWCKDEWDDHSIYGNATDEYKITKAIDFQKYVVGASGVTIVPTSSHNTDGNGCNFWYVTKTDGMLTHTATITTPSHGTIHLAYTDVSSTAQDKTSTTADLAHRTKITASATPDAGYELTSFTVTPEGGVAQNLTSGATDNHILATNATFAATFGAKTITITWNGNGGTPSKASDTWVYDAAALASLPSATNGSKIFVGWFTLADGGSQIDNVGGSNKPTADVEYFAHWSDGNTVYFHPGVGSVAIDHLTQTTYGGAVAAFPTPTIDCDGWSFAGWKEGSAQEETTTNPEASLYAGGHTGYVPATATVNMYAVWKKNFGGGTGDVTSTYDWDSNTTGWTTAGTTQNSGGVDNSKYANLGGTGYMTYNSQVKVKGLSFAFKLSSNNTKGTIKVQKATNSTFSSGLTDVRTWTISQMSASSSSWTTYSTEVSDFDGATNCYVRLAYIQEGNSTVARYFDDIVVTYTGTIPDSYKWTSTPEDYGCVSANQVKTPVISPNTEDQTGDVSVTITCATDDATIRYTTDGTNPTSSSGTVYSGAFTVSCSATVKAIAYKATMDDSEIASQAYTITVPTPTFSLVEGTYYDANQSVTLSLPTAHTGTVIKYTTNGDDPTSSSATYSSAITVTEGTTTIKAIGYNATCGTSSSVASATYIVRFGTDYTLVTDANDLMAGDQLVIISADAGTSSKYAISTTISANKRTSTNDYNINAGLTTATIYPAVGAAATVQVFTLGGEPGAWTFHETTNNGYLNCPSAGKLTNTANVSNSNKWTISIASNIATIHNNEVDATIKSNTGSNHVFAAYGPLTENVQLVKLYSIPNPDPVIKIDADLSAFSACQGSASEYQSFYISGKNLDGNIVLSNVAPLAGYEFCLTSGGTYTATLELPPVSKTVAKTQVYVRLSASAAAGTKNGNLNAAVSANSLSTNIAVTGSVSVADTYTDQVHNTVVANQCGDYYAPSCPDASSPADESCVETHFKFMGWISEADKNSSGVKDDAWYIAHLVTAGTPKTANGTNYYAVWAKEED